MPAVGNDAERVEHRTCNVYLSASQLTVGPRAARTQTDHADSAVRLATVQHCSTDSSWQGYRLRQETMHHLQPFTDRCSLAHNHEDHVRGHVTHVPVDHQEGGVRAVCIAL